MDSTLTTENERYQVMPALSDEQYQALKADIAERGVLVPVEYDEDGNILDGFHRVRACCELGIEDWLSIKRLGLTEVEKRTHARRVNMNRRHLTQKQKREQIKAQLLDTPRKSNREIARILGVDDKTVAPIRSELESGAEIPHLARVVGADGKEYPAKMLDGEVGDEPVQQQMDAIFAPNADTAEKVQQVIDKAQGDSEIADKAKEEVEKLKKGETTAAAAVEAVEKAKTEQAVSTVAFSSESNEYYTPSEYIEAARNVMGGIDLDPASHQVAQEIVNAEQYFTEKDDGLSREWHGRVWLNPPYGKIGNESGQGHWAQYLRYEHEAGRVSEAVLLVKAAVGYEWFEALWDLWPACFARRRLSFIRSDGNDEGQSKQGTVFFYLGENIERFIEGFAQFGRVILPEDHYNETL